MKVGKYFNLFENGYSRWGDARYQKVKEHGFSCIDFSLEEKDSPIYTLSPEESDAFMQNERKMIAEAGLIVSQAHAPFNLFDYTLDEERKQSLVIQKRAVRACAALGCKHLVVHPITPCGIWCRGNKYAEKTWEMNFAYYRELLEVAKEYDVILCFENMPWNEGSLSRPADILEFVEKMNDDNFKICLDTGHANLHKETNMRQAILSLKDHLRVLHVHDNECGVDTHQWPGYGSIDWKELVQTLREIQFDGVFSLEVGIPEMYPDDIYEEASKNIAKIGQYILNL